MQNVFFYDYKFGCGERHGIDPKKFLAFKMPVWGGKWWTKPNFCGEIETKSVMLVSVWLLYWLGFRTVFLLGTDFKMRPEEPYAFEHEASAGYAASNNTTFNGMRKWFRELRPEFERMGLRIYNCTPKTRLREFPRISLEKAGNAMLEGFPPEGTTKGLY